MPDLQPKFSRRSFIAFCLVMLVVIGGLIWWRVDANAAQFNCKTVKISVGNPAGGPYVNYSLTQWATFCYDGRSWVDGKPDWKKDYGEGIWQFSKWLTARFDRWGGVGKAPNGTENVKYITNIRWAEFKLCLARIAPICYHTSLGSKMQVWANSQARVWRLNDN
jgi:hypothetical protein